MSEKLEHLYVAVPTLREKPDLEVTRLWQTFLNEVEQKDLVKVVIGPLTDEGLKLVQERFAAWCQEKC